MATGATSLKFALNLSFILHPCVCVATIVVSEINDRLSPKKAPPTTTPHIIAVLIPVESANPVAIGMSATTVPTLVPIDRETKQAAMNMLAISICGGRNERVILTVLSILPMSLAVVANAPARMKIHIMNIMFSELAPRENMFILSRSGFPLNVSIAVILETKNAITIGTL